MGAALFSIGIPKDSIVAYETDLKADKFLVMARGPADEMARAKSLLATFKPARVNDHAMAVAV